MFCLAGYFPMCVACVFLFAHSQSRATRPKNLDGYSSLRVKTSKTRVIRVPDVCIYIYTHTHLLHFSLYIYIYIYTLYSIYIYILWCRYSIIYYNHNSILPGPWHHRCRTFFARQGMEQAQRPLPTRPGSWLRTSACEDPKKTIEIMGVSPSIWNSMEIIEIKHNGCLIC